ncbi:hypothetical protein [Nocardia sp. NBC_00403]|uniref:hypothetical protein n=1 Tax=Nocardia sp. NBC_00403 TaxID=2975990 RepID=UPI002E1BA404
MPIKSDECAILDELREIAPEAVGSGADQRLRSMGAARSKDNQLVSQRLASRSEDTNAWMTEPPGAQRYPMTPDAS